MPHAAPKTLLVISQVYVPDPASLGQHMHDAAAAMVQRGYRVIVYASARGYDEPTRRYPRREVRDGVEIRRLPLSSFGKGSIALRLVGGFLFVAQAMLRGVFTRNLTTILVSTSPPMASMAAVFIRLFRRAGVVFWAMDLNPDQMVAMGRTRAGSLPARGFDWLNRRILRCASAVVTLDRYMSDRLAAKAPLGDRLIVMPPWPHEEGRETVAHTDNPFRREHGLEGKFVLMYSGNISPAHPVATILEAAKRLRDEPDLLFLFIGGGLGKRQIDDYIQREGLTNVRTLPYQPLDRLRFSLSAADAHLVAMGDNMVGIVHPCKVYGAMAAGRPILLLGPRACHVGELLDAFHIGWQVEHGQVDAAVRTIQAMRRTEASTLAEMGMRARTAVSERFSKQTLCAAFCDVIEASNHKSTEKSRGVETADARR